MQVLIYAKTPSPRLQYICPFIFGELLGLDFVITASFEELLLHEGIAINYSKQKGEERLFSISDHGLLSETTIEATKPDCFEADGMTCFFRTENSDYPFDIFAASFYLLSRYEEYLPHTKDMYGRYAHENSVAFRENFLHLPLINIWVKHFSDTLGKKFPAFTHAGKPSGGFKFMPTYDIDIAFSFRNKGWLRNIGGFLKSPSLKRIKVLLGLAKDPFDTFDLMDKWHKKYDLSPVYFFLLAQQNGRYDKNILPQKSAMKKLIQSIAKNYVVGIHPSWQSGDNGLLMNEEKNLLETISGDDIVRSRQHYIRFSLPDSFRQLIAAGITDDYSMGYGSINGFRASVASSFYWFDLQKNESTNLKLHPFCFMEANSFYEQKYSPAEGFDELMRYCNVCKDVNGQLISIWHNHFFGTDPIFEGWRKMYEKFLDTL